MSEEAKIEAKEEVAKEILTEAPKKPRAPRTPKPRVEKPTEEAVEIAEELVEDAPKKGARKSYSKNNLRGPKRKVCAFCEDKTAKIDYKDIARLRRFVTEKGKILPRRQTGVCAKHQRELTTAIKRARVAAILPFAGE